MKSKELLKQVQKVESEYKSVLDAPDEVMKPIIEISAHLESDTGHPVVDHRVAHHSIAITEALNRIDTSNMTADEIMDYLNSDIDVTYNGTKFMDKHTLYSLLRYRKVSYKHKSKGEYNPQILRGKKE